MNKKIIVLATSRKTRGGITSVIKEYEKSKVWEKWNCSWIGTYVDRGNLIKLLYFIKAFFHFLYVVPSAGLIHIHFSESTTAVRKTFFFVIAKIFQKPVILHFHAFSPEDTLQGKRKKLYKELLKQADAIIALSHFWKIQIENIIGITDKIKVIYNPCPTVYPDNSIEKQNIILFAGTLIERKGYKDLIKAFSRINKVKCKNWKLVFAGNGEIEKGKSLAQELHVDDKILFKGWISGNEKDELFKSSSIFFLPSYAEGFPMAVLDAWAYGIPIITTPVGGLPDILVHGENAMVFEAGDIQGLAKNLESLICNEELRIKISKSSLELSQGLFNIKTISNQLDELYTQLCLR